MLNPDRAIPVNPPGRPEVLESVLLEALRAGRGATLIAQGNSMMPVLRAGSVVRIEPASRAALGEVVATARPDGGLALHRVVGHAGDLVFTWGDALRSPDTWGPSVVLGRVVSPATDLASLGPSRSWRARLHVALGPHHPRLSRLSRALWKP